MSATPGRERGISVVTDNGGYYRFNNGPSQGLVNLQVEADGYASTSVLNKQLKPDAPNQFNLEIESATQHVHREIDRLTELITGVRAFAVTDEADPGASVDRYLELTDAEARFPALLDAVVQRTPAAGADSAELSRLLADIDRAVGPDPSAPMLTTQTLGDTPVLALSFTLPIDGDQPLASLIFDGEAFLQRAMVPNPHHQHVDEHR